MFTITLYMSLHIWFMFTEIITITYLLVNICSHNFIDSNVLLFNLTDI